MPTRIRALDTDDTQISRRWDADTLARYGRRDAATFGDEAGKNLSTGTLLFFESFQILITEAHSIIN